MSRDACIDDANVYNEVGSIGNVPPYTRLPDFPLLAVYPDHLVGQSENPRLVVDPSGRRLNSPPVSPTGRKSLNTEWSTLGRTSPKAAGVRKKKGVDP